jgi:hypothetical protein
MSTVHWTLDSVPAWAILGWLCNHAPPRARRLYSVLTAPSTPSRRMHVSYIEGPQSCHGMVYLLFLSHVPTDVKI